MGDQSGSARLRALFKSALQAYENNTGITLAGHPLAMKVQNCCSVEFVTTLLQDQIRASSAFRGDDRIIKSIKSIISTLSTLSATTALDWAIDLVRQVADDVFHISEGFLRHSHQKMQYTLVLLSSLRYVRSITCYMCILVTSMSIGPSRAWNPATMRSSMCSSRSNAFSGTSICIPRSPIRPHWTKWCSRWYWSCSPSSSWRPNGLRRGDRVSLF